MTRRDLLGLLAPAALQAAADPRVVVPIHRIVDARVKNPPNWPKLWNEAVQDFRQGGIDFQISDGPGEVRRTAADNPNFIGLKGRAINVIATDTLPMYWDGGRALAGVSTIHDGYHICMDRAALCPHESGGVFVHEHLPA